MKCGIRIGVLFAVVLGGLVFGVRMVGADHYDSLTPTGNHGGSDCTVGDICQQDNTTMTVYVNGLGPKLKTASQRTLNDSYTTTDLNVSYQSTPVTSGGSETDVMYETVNNLPAGILGNTYCDDDDVAYECDQHYVQYHGDELCPGVYCNDSTALWALACHETGHAVGLLHGDYASPQVNKSTTYSLRCMRDPFSYTDDDPLVGSHNADQINDEY